MSVTADSYTYRVIWSDEDQEYVGLVAEFPSLSWFAATSHEAMSGIVTLVADILIEMTSAGETPPEPQS